MATVFKAHDELTGLEVAIKLPHPEIENDPALLDHFRRELEQNQRDSTGLAHAGDIFYQGERYLFRLSRGHLLQWALSARHEFVRMNYKLWIGASP